MNPNQFFGELKRRNVYKVAIAYGVVAWLLMQVASQIFPFFDIPNWVVRLVVLGLILGFPIALIIAWAFELTPEGIKRTETADALPAAARSKKRVWIYVVVICGAISAALFLLGRYTAQTTRPAFDDLRRGKQSNEAAASALPKKSIAVLPFDNLSRDPDNAFFTEGVQDEILTRLAKVADLKVIARTSTQKFKSAPENLSEIAKQLGVLNILEGSVQKANDQVRVNVQLINAMTSTHLWAEIYDRKLTDIFAVESDIAKSIADTLQAKLTGSEKRMMSSQPTTDTTAYELYHKGRSLWERRSGDNIPRAIAFYEQAIARDPNYAPAYAGLANAYALLPIYTATAPRDANPKAKEAAMKAFRLDPNLAEAHVALAKMLYFDELDLAGAIREYRRAIELQPNYATAHHWLGNDALASLGRFEEAIAEGRRAVELDPLSPIINADLGVTMYLARRYDEAIGQFKKALELDPTFFYSHYCLGLVLEQKGDLAGAIAEYEKAKQLSDDPYTLALWAAARTRAGDKNAAPQALAALDRINQEREVLAYHRIPLYLSMNNKDEAIRCLEQSFQERDGGYVGRIRVDPLLDPLRGDPRFEALAEKIIPASEFKGGPLRNERE